MLRSVAVLAASYRGVRVEEREEETVYPGCRRRPLYKDGASLFVLLMAYMAMYGLVLCAQGPVSQQPPTTKTTKNKVPLSRFSTLLPIREC